MTSPPFEIKDVEGLQAYVNQTLCDLNELEVGAFPMTERILVRRGSPCGMYFCLHGPRSVKLTAIWETDRNSLLFYSSNGERVCKAELTEALEVAAPPLKVAC
jgi:hypothetical protein